MDKKIHFIMTSARRETRSFAVSETVLKSVLCACFFLVLGGCFGWFFSGENLVFHQRFAAIQKDLAATSALNARMQARTTKQEQEQQKQQAMFNAALADLKHKSKVIESILTSVGVKLDVRESSKGAGGPFIKRHQDSYEGFTLKMDHYLDIIQSVPLGPPVLGTITSQFGRRLDPINNQPAFHRGIDIRNNAGIKVIAPADGVVVANSYDSGHGNFIEINHGNKFLTRYLHLQRDFVKQGDPVVKGQLIGLVGNSGRSTGPHLHYEIEHQGKLIDPIKFVQISSRVAAVAR